MLTAEQSQSTAQHTHAIPFTIPVNVAFHRPSSEGRNRVETFLKQGFYDSFQVTPTSYMPLIMETTDLNSRTTACFGIRDISESTAFLEYYLSASVEQAIAEQIGAPVDRKSIIELGSIISRTKGAGGWLIIAATAWLRGARYQWGVLTATDDLKGALAKQGVELYKLADAKLEHLPEAERNNWGSYYDHDPVVYAAPVQHTYKQFVSNPMILKTMGGLMTYCHTLGQQGIFHGR